MRHLLCQLKQAACKIEDRDRNRNFIEISKMLQFSNVKQPKPGNVGKQSTNCTTSSKPLAFSVSDRVRCDILDEASVLPVTIEFLMRGLVVDKTVERVKY